MSQNTYTADMIVVAKDIEQIRRSPTYFISTREVAGQIHMIREIADNSVDELVDGVAGGTIIVAILKNITTGGYQVVIKDEGRGIPSEALINAMTILGASAKASETGAYSSGVAGQFGSGAKVAVALSKRFRVLSKNIHETDTSSLTANDGKVLSKTDSLTSMKNGVISVFEPDLKPEFFTDGHMFLESGYLDLASLFKQWNIFNDNIVFKYYIYERAIDERFWDANAADAYNIVEALLANERRHVEYDTSLVTDKTAYLFSLWKLNSNLIFQDEYHKTRVDDNDRLSFDIQFYISKKSAYGNPQYYISINNVAIPDKTENSATVSFLALLRQRIAELQPTPILKQYVEQEYRFPTILVAINIKYVRASLSGATKSSFKDSIFAKQFMDELTVLWAMRGDDYWTEMANHFAQDIETRYAQTYDAPARKSDDRKVFTELNFPKNYSECRHYDNAELYLVEGTSAGNIIETREADFQAVYLTRGKPTNAATVLENIDENRKKLLADPIYRDLMKILNITPNTKDMSTSRFKRIIIATDADPDGYHIRAIHLNNLYIINPLIVESGMVWLADPPLYSMEINKSNKLFIRDKVALMDARIKFLYKPSLGIKIQSDAGVIELNEVSYRETCYLVNFVGEKFESVAKQLNIPLLILERLVLAIEHIYPVVNFAELEKWFYSADNFDYIKVQYNEIGKFLVISVGKEDHIIGLDAIGETIVTHLLPITKKYMFSRMMFLITSNHVKSDISVDTPMSMMGLYKCFKELDNLFKVSRYKGLGEMYPKDCYDVIMNPSSRSLTRITDIGDPAANYAIIGKDPSERKRLLSSTSVVSDSFVKGTI